MKRKLACFGMAFALAELFAANMPPLVLVPAAALFALLVFLFWHYDIRIPLLGSLCGTVFFLLFILVNVLPLQQWVGQQVRCTVTVETDAARSYRDGYLRGTLRVTQCDGEAADFLVNCAAFPAAKPGECFSADFLFLPLEENAYRTSYQSNGVYLQAEYQGNYCLLPESSAPRFALFQLRQNLSNLLQRWMPAEEGELEAAMLLGSKDELRDSIQDSFRAAGVSHLLAVSGLHVALLCGIFSFGRHRRFLRPLILLRAALVVFYMVLTGLPISVLRAGFVFLLALAGDFFLQPVDLLTSTGAAAVVISLQNAYAPCDVGFQLSFCAVLGVQAAGTLFRWEKGVFPAPEGRFFRLFYALLLRFLETFQVALFASIATMPVLIAHGLTASGVSLLTNLLVVWMLQPALLLGVFSLFIAPISALEPVSHLLGLLLTVWLRWMLVIVNWCASLPMAYIDLPRRYTLLVFAVLGILAFVFWKNRQMIWYLPAATVCGVFALVLGVRAERDVVRISMVGADNNPCVVCTQNGEALILFRGGQSNLNAVNSYLAERAQPDVVGFVDLRQSPSELNFDDFPVESIENMPAYSTQDILDDLTLDLYHDESGNLAVLEIADRHIAVMAGNIRLQQPVNVDVICAAGALSDSVRADTIITCTDTAKWISNAAGKNLLYSSDVPVILIRPGISVVYEEVEPLALQ
ncbi:ComEC/Rec2 family competence protein [uncultured Subdoligranulum sp.]|uniref:ComEC/Rec2 family competence protein n=1 Tax=uncultured Subdoligranulum sp. TaxID=512298 RepID=UPI002604E4F4|nr:ComEC/Rec2 family competence protein [uncultured Subdoligranulum sp.]